MLQHGGQRDERFERVSHASLLVLYALAAVFGLFLHTTAFEARHADHVCGVSSPDLDRSAPSPLHDEAHCNLCHLLARLAVATPTPAPTPEMLPPVSQRLLPAADAPRRSAFFHTPPSRAPPRLLVA